MQHGLHSDRTAKTCGNLSRVRVIIVYACTCTHLSLKSKRSFYRNDSERDQPEDTHSDHGLGKQIHSYHEDATQSDRFNRDDDFTTFPPWSQTVTAATARFTRDIT